MLYLFHGTDREKVRAEMNKSVRAVKGAVTVRITDTNTVADLQEALRGGGMFGLTGQDLTGQVLTGQVLTGQGGKRVVVFDNVFVNEEMKSIVLDSLPHLKESEESIYILEEKLDAETRKKVEKYAEIVKKFEVAKEKKQTGIFALAYALKSGEKKRLWVEYQRALLRDEAPEAIHGVLFWGAKQAFLTARVAKDKEYAGKLVAELAELPHESRRRGFELEYALERYILSINKP